MTYRGPSPFRSPSPYGALTHRVSRSPDHFNLGASHQFVRNVSRENLHRQITSPKGPLVFETKRVVVSPVRTVKWADEDKIGLYSELERLNLLNTELKIENGHLKADLETKTLLNLRIPELEATIRTLEKEISIREGSLNHTLREQEVLALNNANLSRFEPAYRELRIHNKTLIEEIDRLNFLIKDLEKEGSLLLSDLKGKDKDLEQYRLKIEELNQHIGSLTLENRQLKDQNIAIIQSNSDEAVKKRLKELELEFEKKVIELKNKLDTEMSALVGYEKAQLAGRHDIELRRKEEEMNILRKIVRDLENRLVLTTREVEQTHQKHNTRHEEAQGLKFKLSQMEAEKRSLRDKVEIGLRYEQETKDISHRLTQQQAYYEGSLNDLRTEIEDLHRLEDVVALREKEILELQVEHAKNKQAWENKLKEVENVILEAEDRAAHFEQKAKRFENETNLLAMELDRLKENLKARDAEINELKRIIAGLEYDSKIGSEEQKQRLENEHRKVLNELVIKNERSQTDIEQQMLKLVEENQELNSIAEESMKELEKYRQQAEEMQERFKMAQRLEFDKEIHNITRTHNTEKINLETKIMQLNADLERKALQYEQHEQDHQRLRILLKEREHELQEERRRYTLLENQGRNDLADLRDQFEQYKRNSVEANLLQIRFEAEKVSLTSQLAHMKEKAEELEKRLQLILEENKMTRELCSEKSSEVESLRKGLRQDKENWLEEKRILENEIEELRRSDLDMKEMSIRFNSEKTHYENQIKQLRTITKNGREELEKLYELMNQRKEEYDYYIKQNEELKKEVERLNRLLREGDNGSNKKDINVLYERTIAELEKERDLYRDQAEKLNINLHQVYAELQHKVQELDRSKQKYDEAVLKLSAHIDQEDPRLITRSPDAEERDEGDEYNEDEEVEEEAEEQ